MKEKSVAIVLAAGHGKRMNSPTAKQFLLIKGKPIIYYSLYEFEQCPFIHEIILVTGAADVEYCRKEVVEKFGFSKVHQIVIGGEERYHSVYHGLMAAGECDFVYIHDGARPFVTQAILKRTCEAVRQYQACVAGMPVKDTIKIIDENGFSAETPKRSRVWQVQTPQVFVYTLVREAYEKLMEVYQNGSERQVTDDAMVVEMMTDIKVKLVEGSYSNIKITTPEDLEIAENLIGK